MSNSKQREKEWEEMTKALEEDEKKLISLGVIQEDDFELGEACGLDPEVCESCQ